MGGFWRGRNSVGQSFGLEIGKLEESKIVLDVVGQMDDMLSC